MQRHRDFKREGQIRKLHEEGLNLCQIAEAVNAPVPTVRRTLGLVATPKQPLEGRLEALEDRLRILEQH